MNKLWHDIKIIVTVFFLMVCSVAVTLWIVRETRNFSSPPPSVPVPAAQAGAGRIISTMDLQRELNQLYPELKLAVDGVYGPPTKAAHERVCGDQYANELMAWEAK